MVDDPTVTARGFDLLFTITSARSGDELRRDHCQFCGHYQKDQIARRACQQSRCQLLDPETFRLEQYFILACRELLYAPDEAHLEEMNAFNWYIHAVGCVTPAMRPGTHGFWERSVMGEGTMRGLLHGALFTFLAKQAGDYLSVNVGMTKREVLEVWSRKREVRDRGDAWHAAFMKDAKYSIAEICERLGRRGKPLDRATVRRMIERGRVEED